MKNFLVLKAAKSSLCDACTWMVEGSSGARMGKMDVLQGGLCGVHLPVVIEEIGWYLSQPRCVKNNEANEFAEKPPDLYNCSS